MKNSLKTAVILLLVIICSSYIYAWTGAPGNPPSGNVPAPINVGSSLQTKMGEFIVGSSTTALPAGNVSLQVLGKAYVSGRLLVDSFAMQNGAGLGKVLTSDESGVASWKDVPVPVYDNPGPEQVYFSNKEIETSGNISTAQTFCDSVAMSNGYQKGYVVAYDDLSGKDVFTCWLYQPANYTYQICLDGTGKCVTTNSLSVSIDHQKSKNYTTDTFINQVALGDRTAGQLVIGTNIIRLKVGLNYWNLWGDNGDADPGVCNQGVRDEITFADGSKITTDDWTNKITGYLTGFFTENNVKYVWNRSSGWSDCAAVNGGRVIKVTIIQ